ncbi:MAG: NAD(P)/FAD-dependent oxidoreductase [Bacteroidetes bacterium]|nr:NAD(P)/FAD-dependent oxidoreductase [Bacteroidota bacterium]
MGCKKVIIIGAGPGGLTASYELLKQSDFETTVIEANCQVGGLSRTVNHRGNRIDIGGHRFFSNNHKIIEWWLSFLPLEKSDAPFFTIKYQQRESELKSGMDDPNIVDDIMLIRNRKSRIYHDNQFFDYPLNMNFATLQKFGFVKSARIMGSYIYSRVFPIQPEISLKDFLINRFGVQLYERFFEKYTEKVWGVPCDQIGKEWGAQRIKSIDLLKMIKHFISKLLGSSKSFKNTSSSLTEQFLYPKFGPGQMWESVQRHCASMQGQFMLETKVIGISLNQSNEIESITVEQLDGTRRVITGDYFISSMPIVDLIHALESSITIPEEVMSVAEGLVYRDMIVVGLLIDKKYLVHALEDNWIYIQENHVKVGRIEVFNNWSPYLISDDTKVWLGMEYFCFETDAIWQQSDEAIFQLAMGELKAIGLLKEMKYEDGIVIKEKKTYPAYFGTYSQIHILRNFIDEIPNLYLIGRNGMHKYNNQDHSMLTAMKAVDAILHGGSKSAIWEVNTDDTYQEN